jgi:NAD(P)-dependent dehydrogenase (short-subunit alcohol dehydrogenase family)
LKNERVVLVTGATGGLGPEVANAFVATGARLSFTARKLAEGKKLQEALGVDADLLLPFVADVTNAASLAQWVAAVKAKWNRIDVLVAIAGGYRGGKPVHETDESDWDFLMNLNARSVFLCARAVVPVMLEQSAGKIITVGARAGLSGGMNGGAYAASKSAVHRLTESLSAELRERGINVNAVLPSMIDTPANRTSQPNADFSKWVGPKDLANVIVFLASDEASAIHGALIPVYGLA